eukprot:SAG31_NODE_680_length_12881_cov_35.655453_8_plen_63_part_00
MANISLPLSNLSTELEARKPNKTNKSYHVRDILVHRDLGIASGTFTATVRPHAVVHVVLTKA